MATPTTPSCVLVTGANSGLGFDCARQLASIEGVEKILLACRSEEKASAAKERLEELTQKKLFDIVVMDVSDLASVRKALETLTKETIIDGVILNAGGGGGPNPIGLTKDGVTNAMAVNMLGHVLLVDELLRTNKLSGQAATVVYSGSESARGIPQMSLAPPKLASGSIDEFKSICDGTFFPEKDGKDPKLMGAFTKFVGALWVSSMARKHPNVRFVTMSPGATKGTNVRRDLPWYKRFLVGMILNILSMKGKAHSLDVGARRYIDALLDHRTYQTGVFYGSKDGLSGDVVDQSVFLDYFSNESFQDNASAAIHSYIKA